MLSRLSCTTRPAVAASRVFLFKPTATSTIAPTSAALRKSIHTTPITQQAAVAASPQDVDKEAESDYAKMIAYQALQPPDTFSEIVTKYGVIPFTALAVGSMISKEVILVDAELLGAAMTSIFIGAVYVGLGDTVGNAIKANGERYMARYNGLYDVDYAWLKRYKAQMQWQIDVLALREQQAADYEDIMARVAVAETLLVQHKARDAVMQKLTKIKLEEDTKATNERELMMKDLVARVSSKFGPKGDKKNNKDFLDLAISMIGAPRPTSAKDDAVKRVFKKELGL